MPLATVRLVRYLMGMNRREFIKSCSLVAMMGLLGACRKIPLDKMAGDLPSLKQFQDEVKLAMSQAKRAEMFRTSALLLIRHCNEVPQRSFSMTGRSRLSITA